MRSPFKDTLYISPTTRFEEPLSGSLTTSRRVSRVLVIGNRRRGGFINPYWLNSSPSPFSLNVDGCRTMRYLFLSCTRSTRMEYAFVPRIFSSTIRAWVSFTVDVVCSSPPEASEPPVIPAPFSFLIRASVCFGLSFLLLLVGRGLCHKV